MVASSKCPMESILDIIFSIPATRAYWHQDDSGLLSADNADNIAFFAPFRHVIADIMNHYSLPHRHIYSTEVFNEFLKLYTRYNCDESFNSPEYVGLAIIYSQIISNPLRDDNYQLSAAFATKSLMSLQEHIASHSQASSAAKFIWLTPDFIQNISNTITNMSTFVVPSAFGSNYETDEIYHDCAWVYDILQSHLGADSFKFNAYEDAHYYEHILTPFDEYFAQRKAQLSAITKNKAKIYISPMMFREYERYARENIADFDGSCINQPYEDDIEEYKGFVSLLQK